MVPNSSGSQWVIGHVIWFSIALNLSGLLIMLYGSQQLWLSMGFLLCYMVHSSSSSQYVIVNELWFKTALALNGLLVMIYGSQQLWLPMGNW